MEIRKTEIFVEWLDNLGDSRARTRIIARLDRMEMGNFGDVRPVVAASMNYASIMAQVTEYILSDAALSLSYFYAAATKTHNMQTSQKRKC